MPLSMITMVRLRGLTMPMVARQPSDIRIEPSPSSAITPRSGWASASAASCGQAHAAEHVEILRPVAGGIEVEIGVADARDHCFVALEFRDRDLADRRVDTRRACRAPTPRGSPGSDYGTISDASALAISAKPLVCIITTPRSPPI